jgi:L-Ala-D/L-Glu epimerase
MGDSQLSPLLRSALRIQSLKILPYCIPLRHPLTTAHSTLTTRQGAMLEILTAEGITGRGEIAPLPDFGGAHLDDALTALHHSPIVSALLGQELDEALAYLSRTGDSLPASTLCGLEIALLDALAQTQQCSISKLLMQRSPCIVPRTHIHVNAVIGASTPKDAVNDALAAIASGFGCLKLKLGLGLKTDIERVYAVREAIGPAVQLRLDANEAWNFGQAYAILTACAPLAIQYVEQPLPADDLLGMHHLRQAVSIPIAADESIDSYASACRVLAARAADVLIIKPQLVGGLYVSRRIIQETTEYSVKCVITSMIETGIGVIATLHLVAASPEVTLACGLATLPMLEDDLVTEPLPLHNGMLAVPTGAGLGVDLDRHAMANYAFKRSSN